MVKAGMRLEVDSIEGVHKFCKDARDGKESKVALEACIKHMHKKLKQLDSMQASVEQANQPR